MNVADQPYAIGRGLAAIRGVESDDSKFVLYALEATLARLLSGATGSTFPSLSRDQIASHIIPVPPLGDRQAIGTLLGAIDDKIAAGDRAAHVAFDLADSMVLELLEGRARENFLPTTFGRLGTLFDGPHATPTRTTEGPYFLNISSLKSGRLDLAESDHVSELDFSKWTRRVTPQAGDLLFSYETRLGEAALMPNGVRACLGRRMALLRPDRGRITPEFLLHFYLSPTFQRTIAERTIHGATVARIGLATMGEWNVDVPEMEEQQGIAATLRSLHAVVDQFDRESAILARTRDELLPLLMSGKVRVKDAEATVSEVV
jgi:type I restriction enzyme S subunit